VSEVRVTRIGRYENPYLNVEMTGNLPDGTTERSHVVETEDAAACHGFLYLPPGSRPRTVVAFMHPRADFSRHYAVPFLLRRGYAAWTQNSRSVGNDSLLLHERVLLDVAGAVRRLRAIGFDRVVLCGNSGGGSLYTFYVSQAHAKTGSRLVDLPTGEPFDLNRFAMPRVDAIVYLAAHPGEGHILLSSIDPSVSDESDPLSRDPSLDMYDPRNGFAPPPESSHYSADFVARFRAAQRLRVETIDRRARADVARRREARRRAGTDANDVASRRSAVTVPMMIVYRTNADPRFTDLALDPSERGYGDLWGFRPDLFNWGPIGFGRVVSADAWLSTWSGLSSRAEIVRTGAAVDVPALVVSYSGDNAIFPSETDLIFDALGTSAKSRTQVQADHYGFPIPSGPKNPREIAINTIADWLDRSVGR
jgi:pimeloyl-ACP methyl ester carboxylesterase